LPPHQHQEPPPQLLWPHSLVYHLEIDVEKVVTPAVQAVRCPDAGIRQVIEQRGFPDPAVADHGARLELLVAEPAEDLFHLARPSEEPAWIRDRITISKRIALHNTPT